MSVSGLGANKINIEPYDPFDLLLTSMKHISVPEQETNFDFEIKTSNFEGLPSDAFDNGVYITEGILKILPSNTNVNENDYIKLQIVDINNVLGYGANTILKFPYKKIAIWKEREAFFLTGGYHLLSKGLFIRLIYVSATGSLATDFIVEILFKLRK